MQQRSDEKDYCPGYFDVPTGGVVAAGESDEDCAERELREELGLSLLGDTSVRLLSLRYLDTYFYEDELTRCFYSLWEAEISASVTDAGAQLALQAEEVAGVRMMTAAQVFAESEAAAACDDKGTCTQTAKKLCCFEHESISPLYLPVVIRGSARGHCYREEAFYCRWCGVLEAIYRAWYFDILLSSPSLSLSLSLTHTEMDKRTHALS